MPDTAASRSFEHVFTEEETTRISEVKSKLSEEDLSESFLNDFFILRFLRARDMNVAKATDMLKASIQWRRDNNVIGLLDRPRPPKLDYLLSNVVYHKYDKEGRPVVICKYGTLVSELSRLMTLSEFIECQKWINENYMYLLQDASEKHHKHISKFTLITDMSGLSLSAYSGIKYLQAGTEMNQLNYPETMGRSFVVHAPRLASVLYNLFKRVLDPAVQEKISLHSGTGIDAILEVVDKASIPVELGGSCAKCDGACMPKNIQNVEFTTSRSEEGDDIDIENNLDSHESVHVGAGKTHEHVVQIGSDGGELKWHFTASNEVDFSAHFCKGTDDSMTSSAEVKTSEERQVVVHAVERVPRETPITGSFSTREQGSCTFRWSNEFSYFRSKTVKFHVSCYGNKQESEDTKSKHANGAIPQSHPNGATEVNASPSGVVLPWTTRLIPGSDGWQVDCEVKESSIPGAGQGTYVKERCPSGTVLRFLPNVDFDPTEPLKPGTRVGIKTEGALSQFLTIVENNGETNVQQKASWYAESNIGPGSPDSIHFYVPGSAINTVKAENATVAYRQVQVDSDRSVVEIYAVRDLSPGDELFCDYTYLPVYPEWFRNYCTERGLRDVKSFSDEIASQS